MTYPWRNEEQQLAYEAQLPARFDDGAAWVHLAARAAAIKRVRTSGYRLAPGLRGKPSLQPIPDRAAAELSAIGADYETARLGARWLSLAGIHAVQQEINRAAIAIRSLRDPEAIAAMRLALIILSQAAREPDRRLPWSRVMRDAT